MGTLPTTIIQHIYGYGSTYKDIFGKVLISLNIHFLFIDAISVVVIIMVVTVIVNYVELSFVFADSCISMKIVWQRTIFMTSYVPVTK